MVMSKKEREAMQAAIDRADLVSALRWTSPIDRDVMPPKDGGYVEGWDFNAHSERVWKGWSGAVCHGQGPIPSGASRHYYGAQNGRRMYSTEAKALAAMRCEIEQTTARQLMRIDRRIRELMELAP